MERMSKIRTTYIYDDETDTAELTELEEVWGLEEENKELYNKRMGVCDRVYELEEENRKLNERIRFLEECLDNKEKVNKSLREDLKIWKFTAKDYAKLCWVDLDDDLNKIWMNL